MSANSRQAGGRSGFGERVNRMGCAACRDVPVGKRAREDTAGEVNSETRRTCPPRDPIAESRRALYAHCSTDAYLHFNPSYPHLGRCGSEAARSGRGSRRSTHHHRPRRQSPGWGCPRIRTARAAESAQSSARRGSAVGRSRSPTRRSGIESGGPR